MSKYEELKKRHAEVADCSARLANGQRVKQGDRVAFINSDGERCEDVIRKRKDGTLYFWNCNFEIADYKSAYRL